VVGFFGETAHAQLKWDREDVVMALSPVDKEAVAHFRFKNSGATGVKIASVTTSCGCMSAELKKRDYAPQEEGEILARFKVGDRTGLQTKTVLVESDDPQSPRTILTMKVTIPVVAEVKPVLLSWQADEAPTAKEIVVKIVGGYPVTALTVDSSNPHVKAEVAAVKDKREFRIAVTPGGTVHSINAILKITTDYPPTNPKTFFANVRVQ